MPTPETAARPTRRRAERPNGRVATQTGDAVLRTLLARVPAPSVPTATYRLQFHAGFTFQDARALVGYLRSLGISHVYASPYLRARSGSTHGYDVADPNALNPELGTREDYEAFVAELDAHGMGQVVDVVPNHMGIGDPGNYRWIDVLENGPSSVFAPFFDINWSPLRSDAEDAGKLVMPVLGDQYGRVLENGDLRLEYEDGEFFLHYFEHRFPVAPDTYPFVLQLCLEEMEDQLGRRHEHVQELASVLSQIQHLPDRASRSPEAVEERNREKEIVKRRLRLLHLASAPFRRALEQALRQFQGTPGDRGSFDRLDALIERQAYRLAFWRVAAEEINYRRFFDITELAAVRMEDPRVFAETHRLLLRLIGEGRIDGLRIDHPDGLRDPREYFLRLQRSCFVRYYAHQLAEPAERDLGLDEDQLGQRLSLLFDRQVERDPHGAAARPFYIVVEKILSGDETLPRAWPVHGTTGYDFLNVLNGLFVDRENERFFDNIYARFTRNTTTFHDLANSTKKMVMLISLASEVNELAFRLKRIASHDRRHRDFTLNLLTFAIREVIAALRVYRTYIDPESGQATEEDVARIDQAVAEAKRRNPRTDPSIFDFVRDTLLRRDAESPDQERHHDLVQFVAHFQQTTGPVMAKGVEDTAFYQYNRLVSLNEVGGEPDRFGVSPQAFHRHNQHQARLWPATMLSTSTHDTKRSEDLRARIDVLSELPRDWNAALTRWSRLNASRKRPVDGRPAPDHNEEYLLYQTLLGAWPFGEMDAETYATFKERIAEFLLKALKEAKVHTSWINPNAAYEEAARAFVMAVLDENRSGPFLEDLRRLCEQVAHYGAFNSLSQVVLKLAAPGVPDTYQGNETWDFSLVDPDNRRPVDYALRQRLLDRLESDRARAGEDWQAFVDDLLAHKEDGRIKLHVTRALLGLRQERPSLFVGGRYQVLRTSGSRRRHLVAFARHTDGDLAIVAAPVLVARLTRYRPVAPVGAEVWDDTALLLPGGPGTAYRNLFTNERVVARSVGDGVGVPVTELLAAFPVAVLIRT